MVGSGSGWWWWKKKGKRAQILHYSSCQWDCRSRVAGHMATTAISLKTKGWNQEVPRRWRVRRLQKKLIWKISTWALEHLSTWALAERERTGRPSIDLLGWDTKCRPSLEGASYWLSFVLRHPIHHGIFAWAKGGSCLVISRKKNDWRLESDPRLRERVEFWMDKKRVSIIIGIKTRFFLSDTSPLGYATNCQNCHEVESTLGNRLFDTYEVTWSSYATVVGGF